MNKKSLQPEFLQSLIQHISVFLMFDRRYDYILYYCEFHKVSNLFLNSTCENSDRIRIKFAFYRTKIQGLF